MSTIGTCLLLLAGISQPLPSSSSSNAARVIYLNGVDISSAKNQSLEQVNVRIDARGQIYIEAPQYEVQQESSFVPLSRQTPAHTNLPVHRAPGPLNNEVEAPASKQELASPAETGDTMNQPETVQPAQAAGSGLMEKREQGSSRMDSQAKKDLEHRYHQVCNQINELAKPSRVSLLVVTKGHGPMPLRELFQLGQTSFGENYAQEMIAKSEALQDLPISWVFIGHLQSNKIRRIVGVASEIQTVSSLKHAELIANAAREFGKIPYPIWLECNAGQEESKHGCPLEGVPALAAAIQQNPSLRLRGLMAIPPGHYQDAHTLEVPALYQTLRHLADQIGDKQLSLGMSGDLGLAIRAGSNLVRIGTAILGPRQV